MIIQSKRVWIGSQFFPLQLEMNHGKITNIYEYDSKKVTIDFHNHRIVPGFIDIHTHGAYGFDTNDANIEGLSYWTKKICEEGVTSFCPTTITQSKEVLSEAVANVANFVHKGYTGAEILGIHFEGPYLAKTYKGAQPEPYIVEADVDEFIEYQEKANGLIKIITMACEKDLDHRLTKYCATHDVLVSIGHSAATYEEAILAVANGANSMTHVYNAMSPFNHRAPGLIGAALRLNQVYGEIVCDGNHCNINAIYNFYMLKGKDYAIMVSDSLNVKGCPAHTQYHFGGNLIETYEDGSAHLCTGGNFAGSTLKINEGLKLVVEKALVPFEYAINSCTINPARALKVDDYKGKIAVGYDADIVVLDEGYEVLQTFVKGKMYK